MFSLFSTTADTLNCEKKKQGAVRVSTTVKQGWRDSTLNSSNLLKVPLLSSS